MAERRRTRLNAAGDESRRRIVEATLQIAAHRGYAGTTVTAVVDASGLPASSVYWHFGDKDTLMAEVLEYSYRQYLGDTAHWPIPVPTGPRREVIHGQLALLAKGFETRPEFWRLGLMLLLEDQPSEPAARKRFMALRSTVLRRMERWWAELLDSRDLVCGDDGAVLLAQLTLAAMDGLYVAVHGEEWDVQSLVSMLAAGIDAAIDTVAVPRSASKVPLTR